MVAAFVKRPTSPVHFESAFTSSEDVLLAGSDEEETPEENRNKRRRVESLAKQYLEGKGLFILTAGLRGPLNEGWVNPWASKSSGSKTKEIRRISEVAKRSVEDSTRRKGPDFRLSTVDDASTHREFKYEGLRVVDAPHELQLEHNKNSADAEDDPRVVSYLMRDIGAISHNQSDFRNWNPKELAQINNKPHNHPRGWLKSDNSLISKQPRRKSKSPTPSPAPRIRESHRAQITASPSTKFPSTNSHSRVIPQERKDFVIREAKNFSFTPVNRRIVSTGSGDHFAEYKSSHLDLQNNHTERQHNHTLKRSLLEANLYEADNLSQEGHYAVNDIEQKPLDQSIKHDDHFNSRKQSQDSALETNQISSSTNARESTVYAHDDQVSQAHIEKKPNKNEPRDHKASLQALPASTYLPEFEYRYANKPSTSPAKERLSFAEALEVAKKEAEIKATRRISFMAASGVNGFGSRRSSPSKSESLQKSQPSAIRRSKSIQGGSSPKNDKIESLKNSFSTPPNGNLPTESFAQPEAQVIPAEPAGLAPSGPSTNLLETDKLSSLDEGDSYTHFSTQAAVLRAQQSFQNEFVSAIKKSPRQPLEPQKENQTPQTALRKGHAIGAKILTPAIDDEEPMSTQAMVDAISPFAFSTLKKKKRASFAPSPTTRQSPVSPTTKFPSHSPSMATSISPSPPPLPGNDTPPPLPISRTHSKPSSSGVSLPSFSIAPNGTLTEIFQQDGQHPQQSLDPESWNLEDAIQDASSFLGTWDVETEAKKMAEKG